MSNAAPRNGSGARLRMFKLLRRLKVVATGCVQFLRPPGHLWQRRWLGAKLHTPSLPMKNRGIPLPSKTVQARVLAVLCALVAIWLAKALLIGGSNEAKAAPSNDSDIPDGPRFAVLSGSSAFTDRSALSEYLDAQGPLPEGEEFARSLSEPIDPRLSAAGKQIKFTRNTVVSLVANDAKFTGYCEIAAVNRQGESARLWINRDFLLDETDFDGGRVLTGFWIFRSDEMPMEVGGVEIDNLEDVISAIYSGELSDEVASRCVFMPNLQCGIADQKTGDYVIYRESDPQGGADLQFAVKEGASGETLYSSPVRYVGREEFTTRNGTIRRIPVVAPERRVK